MEDARTWALTRCKGSNLALALGVLPTERRRAMQVFYAFCREVDDLADEPGLSIESRRARLREWREFLSGGTVVPGRPGFASVLGEVFSLYEVPAEWPVEIVRGCEMDLEGCRYRTWGELREYCYRVASAVGLISARIFGGQRCEGYAEALGLALQMTNILRDSAEDYAVLGRVYFPEEELEAFGIRPGAWASHMPEGWEGFMQFQLERTRAFYESAVRQLPADQRASMVAAEGMRAVYRELLEVMARDGFRVWNRRYRLGIMRKLWLMGWASLSALRRRGASE
jgi:phytoene synthase